MALYQIHDLVIHHFPDLPERLEQLSDPRKRKQYQLKELIFGCIMMYCFREGSRNAYNQDRKTERFSSNYSRIFWGMRLPHMDTVDEVFRQIEQEEFERLKTSLIKILLKRRVLHKFRLLGKYFCVAVDATGYASFEEEPYEGCPYRINKKSGKKTYVQPILEAKLVTINGFSLSIGTEWVLNGKEYDKQDCELKAFKRLAAKMKANFPRLPMCILADGLYPNKTVFEICKSNDWRYIITLKDTQLKDVQEEVAVFDQIYGANTESKEKVRNKKQIITRIYRWINEIDYHGYQLNWIECVETKRDIKADTEEKNRFGYVTDFNVNSINCIHISGFGRLRWKVENEGFNIQKNGGYKLEHKYSRKNLNAMQNYYQCMQIGHMINQLLELSNRFKQLKSKFTIRHIWKVIIAFMYFGQIDMTLLTSKRTQFRYS